MDKLREVLDTDLDAIEIGAAILGTGGGGNPYIGKLRCRLQLQQGRRIKVIPIDELPDDALVVSLGGIGAPVVGVEKIEEGEECLRAMRALEVDLGCKIDALISSEIGGGPILWSLCSQLPKLAYRSWMVMGWGVRFQKCRCVPGQSMGIDQHHLLWPMKKAIL